jgi:hypothetical protein
VGRAPASTPRTKVLGSAELAARLRERRSAAYVAGFAKLDLAKSAGDVLDAIRAEFPELTPEQLPHGIVARCSLGHPFEVHTLELESDAVTHVRRGEPLPGGLERARALAAHPGYLFVEVYPDGVRAVGVDGTVSVAEL